MSCGFIDSTFALLLKIHLRFRGSFLRFHSMAVLSVAWLHNVVESWTSGADSIAGRSAVMQQP